jgi:BirA family biotin operon repressor/biotin-[acetyl-CoA-carboxylase] ligase
MSHQKKMPLLLELNEVESTNNYAMGWINGQLLPKGHEAVLNGMAVLAYHQTAGKGQRGKSWQSPSGESLSLSIVLKPDFLTTTQSFSLLSAVTVSTVQVLQTITGEDTRIKWPNDIYWQKRKLGGILIENLVKGSYYNWAVAGIGVNILQKQFPDFLENPVSIMQITGKEVNIKKVAHQIQEAIIIAMEQLQQNPLSFFVSYNQLLFCKNEKVKLKQGARVFETVIKGVNEYGELMTGEDGLTTFRFGEVEWKW